MGRRDMMISECENSANFFNGDQMLFPQLVAQIIYCWLLNAHMQKKAVGLLAAAAVADPIAPAAEGGAMAAAAVAETAARDHELI